MESLKFCVVLTDRSSFTARYLVEESPKQHYCKDLLVSYQGLKNCLYFFFPSLIFANVLEVAKEKKHVRF